VQCSLRVCLLIAARATASWLIDTIRKTDEERQLRLSNIRRGCFLWDGFKEKSALRASMQQSDDDYVGVVAMSEGFSIKSRRACPRRCL